MFGFAWGSCLVRVWFVSGFVSEFVSGSCPGSCSGPCPGSCLASVWVRVGFVSGACHSWLVRVRFMSGFVSEVASGFISGVVSDSCLVHIRSYLVAVGHRNRYVYRHYGVQACGGTFTRFVTSGGYCLIEKCLAFSGYCL